MENSIKKTYMTENFLRQLNLSQNFLHNFDFHNALPQLYQKPHFFLLFWKIIKSSNSNEIFFQIQSSFLRMESLRSL